MKLSMNHWMAKMALRGFAKTIVVLLVALLAVLASVKPAHASQVLGLLFNEVNDVHIFKRTDGVNVVVVQGRAWGWYHHVTFPASDSTGRQCLQKFVELMSRLDNKQLQFGGYSSGQTVDQPTRTTRTEFTIITECYFR